MERDSAEALAAAATRLLWGTVIIVVDLRIGPFDVVNDILGAVLVVIGVTRLADWVAAHDDRHLRAVGLARWMAWIALVGAFIEESLRASADSGRLAGVGPDEGTLLALGLGLVQVAGTLLVVGVFGQVSMDAGWTSVAASWHTTRKWFLIAGPLAVLTGGAGYLSPAEAAPAVLVAAGLVLGIAVHLCLSLYRTSRPPALGP